MRNRVAVHQPSLLPWVGFWNKAWSADQFIHLDNVAYSRGDFFNRCKVDGNWLTLPILHKGETLKETRFDRKAVPKVLRALDQALCSAKNPGRHAVAPILEAMEGYTGDSLNELNLILIQAVSRALGLVTAYVHALPLVGNTTTARLRNLLLTVSGPDVLYLSGGGGERYMDMAEFIYPTKFQRVIDAYDGNSVLQLIAREEDPMQFLSTCAVWE